MSIDISSLLERSPPIRHNGPRIAGTGITVHRIGIWYKLGYSAEEITRQYGHLTIAQVYAALAYYHANREEIDAEIAADEEEADRLEKEYLEKKQLVLQ